MFKCVECGKEYQIKPQYCDCGNDIFELSDEDFDDFEQLESEPSNQVQTPVMGAHKTSYFSETKMPKQFDIISISVFVICLILSFVTVFFIGNPKEQPAQNIEISTEQEDAVVQDIPSVETFWDNTVASVNLDVIPQETTSQNIPLQQIVQETLDPISAKFDEWLNKPRKVEQDIQTSSMKVVQTPTPTVKNQTVQTVKTQQSLSQNKTQTVAQTTTPKVNQPEFQDNEYKDLLARIQKNLSTSGSSQKTTTQSQANQTSKPAAQNPTQSAVTSSSVKNTNTVANSQTQIPKASTSVSGSSSTGAQSVQKIERTNFQQGKSQAELTQELNTYKASLRNTIGKKINFTNVVGDGSCSLTFKIDSSGKLTNRAFKTQSSNITLNDAVYSAMISTPSYNPPPEGYKNETLTLSVKMYAGNYEVTLN